jgi:serine/threonine-protein kinase RsbW
LIRLRVPGLLKYRDLAVRTVAAVCKLAYEERGPGSRRPGPNFDEEVVSAFGEAFNNIAIHGYRSRPAGDVEIEMQLTLDRLTVRLIDYGSSFDIQQVPQPDLDALPESGLGIFIIRSFMDAVAYTPGQPNVLSMTKYLTGDEHLGSGARSNERPVRGATES